IIKRQAGAPASGSLAWLPGAGMPLSRGVVEFQVRAVRRPAPRLTSAVSYGTKCVVRCVAPVQRTPNQLFAAKEGYMVGRLSRSMGPACGLKVFLVSGLLMGSAWYAEARGGSETFKVVLNHANLGATHGGAIELRRNQRLRIEIVETNTDCYTYNAVKVPPAVADAKGLR